MSANKNYSLVCVKFWNEVYQDYSHSKEYEYFVPKDVANAWKSIPRGSPLIVPVMSNNGTPTTVMVIAVFNNWEEPVKANRTLPITEDYLAKLLPNTQTSTKDKSMNGSTMKDKLMNKMFQEVSNVKISMDNMTMGISNDGSIYSFNATTQEVDENIFDIMSFDVPAFAMPTPLASVSIGDIIVENSKATGWVSKIDAEKSKVYVKRYNGHNYSINPPKNTMMGGTQNIMVVKNFFSGMGDNSGGMNPMMLMAMSGKDIDPMMMMLMMQGNNGQANNMMNPLMMMALMKDK